ncbi:cytidylate kinase [Lacticaseibacillus saniviri JCM 17471 = DSM 24301]|uniref:Cytidylate kinase n=2 Tax=Lacticaseibacillus saniviri TaxID=931533 RepID=A0A0R2N5D4_9LACO|nr:cytidylate kinase [Lacticaseibacillus saniviri JCM 17471 = DSM 24301]
MPVDADVSRLSFGILKERFEMQIAIDGPASAGKSTIAKLVAKQLGFIYCDTGAMYRAVTLLAIQRDIDFGDEAKIMTALQNAEITFKPGETDQLVFLNGEDISLAIRQPDVTNNVSQVSAHPRVREAMVAKQRAIASQNNIVMDGRDIGTTVLPNAELKIFMVASVEERARRRFAENQRKGIETPLATLVQEIEARDQKDTTREVSPLRQADDAIRIDTTALSIDQVVAKILDLAADRAN